MPGAPLGHGAFLHFSVSCFSAHLMHRGGDMHTFWVCLNLPHLRHCLGVRFAGSTLMISPLYPAFRDTLVLAALISFSCTFNVANCCWCFFWLIALPISRIQLFFHITFSSSSYFAMFEGSLLVGTRKTDTPWVTTWLRKPCGTQSAQFLSSLATFETCTCSLNEFVWRRLAALMKCSLILRRSPNILEMCSSIIVLISAGFVSFSLRTGLVGSV